MSIRHRRDLLGKVFSCMLEYWITPRGPLFIQSLRGRSANFALIGFSEVRYSQATPKQRQRLATWRIYMLCSRLDT